MVISSITALVPAEAGVVLPREHGVVFDGDKDMKWRILVHGCFMRV